MAPFIVSLAEPLTLYHWTSSREAQALTRFGITDEMIARIMLPQVSENDGDSYGRAIYASTSPADSHEFGERLVVIVVPQGTHVLPHSHELAAAMRSAGYLPFDIRNSSVPVLRFRATRLRGSQFRPDWLAIRTNSGVVVRDLRLSELSSVLEQARAYQAEAAELIGDYTNIPEKIRRSFAMGFIEQCARAFSQLGN